DYCESYGHDLLTGATVGPEKFRASEPGGRAILKTADYSPPHEEPDEEYPMRYTTGRTAYHFHTRTKTGRSRPLTAAAPSAWVELNPDDAERMGIGEGDLVRVTSRRGRIEVPVRICDIRPNTVFAPFHYGYWDVGGSPDGHPRAANELTITEWDPVSKQPVFKNAAVKVERIGDATGPAPAPTTTASRPSGGRSRVPATTGGRDAEATEAFDVAPPPRFPDAIEPDPRHPRSTGTGVGVSGAVVGGGTRA
ncbi:MAG TPA: molybdopterin dinucleotide binding domain-containing protein, partial [Propionibacteriaceae bacterium]|nr:molybdopterin dinucleotide binding domain-containing protein [Propionibacteriaceae bacterium]